METRDLLFEIDVLMLVFGSGVPILLGIALWLQGGASLRAALSWTLPTLLIAIGVTVAFDPPLTIVFPAVVVVWCYLMVSSLRLQEFWHVRVLRDRQARAHGRLVGYDSVLDMALEDSLETVTRSVEAWQRRPTADVAAKAAAVLQRERQRLLALQNVPVQWERVRTPLLAYMATLHAGFKSGTWTSVDAATAERHLRFAEQEWIALRETRAQPYRPLREIIGSRFRRGSD